MRQVSLGIALPKRGEQVHGFLSHQTYAQEAAIQACFAIVCHSHRECARPLTDHIEGLMLFE